MPHATPQLKLTIPAVDLLSEKKMEARIRSYLANTLGQNLMGRCVSWIKNRRLVIVLFGAVILTAMIAGGERSVQGRVLG